MQHKVTAIIPARKGSKRSPGKNIRLLVGKPLIAWSIEQALDARSVSQVVVTSDDDAVLEIASSYKSVIALRRPDHLASDSATSADVVLHALNEIECKNNYAVLLQPTSPLRLAEDIDSAMSLMIASGQATCVSASPLEKPPHFYYGKISGVREYFDKYEEVLCLNGAVYAFSVKHFIETKQFTDDNTVVYSMPCERSVDIDTDGDFALAEFRMGVKNVSNG